MLRPVSSHYQCARSSRDHPSPPRTKIFCKLRARLVAALNRDRFDSQSLKRPHPLLTLIAQARGIELSNDGIRGIELAELPALQIFNEREPHIRQLKLAAIEHLDWDEIMLLNGEPEGALLDWTKKI